MFEGIHTALITPMKHGDIDLDALARLVDRQIEAGVQGIVICATTGEGTTMRPAERANVIETVVNRVDKRIKVTVGTGYVATWAVVEATRIAADLGADAALVVSPAYVKPSQEGIAAHYETVADQGGIPIIAYNVPSRTSSSIHPATLARMATHDNIVGIKEASGSMETIQQVIAAVSGRMSILCGDDPLTVSLLLAGGHGVISTSANVVPKIWVDMWNAWKAGNAGEAAVIQAKLLSLHGALFLETNPGPAKVALHQLGYIEAEIRAPLTWPTPSTHYRMAAELENLGMSIAKR